MKVITWWAFLCLVAVVNVTAWIFLATSADAQQARAQLVLSGIYVFGCAFRSFLPVYDIPRLSLANTWASSVLIGRSVATLAELAFAAQWAAFLHASQVESVRTMSLTIVPLITVAQVCCWHAVLTTRNLGHVLENSLWGISAALVVICLGAIVWQGPADRSPVLELLAVGAALFVAYIFVFDVPMYWSRWKTDEAMGKKHLSLAQGLVDISRRSVVSRLWKDWHSEVAWMTLYFSVGVWTSISLVLVSRRI